MVRRRTVLGTIAAAGGLTTTSRTGAAQPTEIRLDGESSGWVGRAPDGISGETNPPLPLVPGETISVTWTNRDGAPHNLVITDVDETELIRTDIVEEEGASQTVEVEATEEMAEYFCEVHPESMRGQVRATSDTATPATETTETTETTEAEQPALLPRGTTIVLGGLIPYWFGLAPTELQGQRNPTLRLHAGAEYELAWINLDGIEHDFRIAGASGEDLVETSSRDDTGETRDTTFEAVPEMRHYYCRFHPDSMRSEIEVV